MRYGISALALAIYLFLPGSASAASIQFSLDFDLVGCPLDVCGNPDALILDGPFPDAGTFSIDDALLGSTQTLIPYAQIQNFSLGFPANFFSFNQNNLDTGDCFSSVCGLLFTGTMFDGFVGSYAFADSAFKSLVQFQPGGGVLEFIVFGAPGIGGGVRDMDTALITDSISDFTVSISPVNGATTPVPEPSSWALLLAGGALVRRYARKRSRPETRS